MNATSVKEVILNVVYDDEKKKVLYAWTEKTFMDVFLSFFTLPLGTIANIFEFDDSNSFVGKVEFGCITKIMHSLNNLSEDYLINGNSSKINFMYPNNAAESFCCSLAMNIDPTQPTQFFSCSNLKLSCSNFDLLPTEHFLSPHKKMKCKCNEPLNTPVLLQHSKNGFVCAASYIIKNDLTVLPFTEDMCGLDLIEGHPNPKSIKETHIVMTKSKMCDLLKCCIFSTSPLTDFFFKKSFGQHTCADSHDNVDDDNVDDDDDSENNLQIPLMIVSRDKKVVSSYCNQNFIEMLITFLTLPLGSVLRALKWKSGLGKIDTLHKSINNIEKSYFMPKAKELLCAPLVAHDLYSRMLPLPWDNKKRHYTINSRIRYDDDQCYISSEEYLESILVKIKVYSQKCEDKGILKETSMYYVNNSLVFDVITPAIHHIQLLENHADDLNSLSQEKITIGKRECLKILRASLTSLNALHDGLRGFLKKVEMTIDEGDTLKASDEVLSVSKEVDKLCMKVVDLKTFISNGEKVDDKEFDDLIESFESQIIKLQSSDVEETKMERGSEVHRVRRYMDAIDNLKERNSTLKHNMKGSSQQ